MFALLGIAWKGFLADPTGWLTAFGTVAAAAAAAAGLVVAIKIDRDAARNAESAAKRAEDRLQVREREQDGRQFRAAALLVRDELRANRVELEQHKPNPVSSAELPILTIDAYLNYRLILAQHLVPESRDCVRAAYRELRRLSASVERFRSAWPQSSGSASISRSGPQGWVRTEDLEKAIKTIGLGEQRLANASGGYVDDP